MNETEVWLLDDELDHAACHEVKQYAHQTKAVVSVREARDVQEFKDLIKNYESDQSKAFVLAFIDHWGPGSTKMAVPALEYAKEHLGQERLFAVLMSDLDKPEGGTESGDLFGAWVDNGGHAYLAKKDITDPSIGQFHLRMQFANASKFAAFWAETQRHRDNAKAQAQLIGHSKALEKVRKLISKVAGTNSHVLVLGESGTGKGVVARAIHYNSQRASGPFVRINCADIAGTLIESELFGHEKGAFTDAKERKKGLLEQAEGGTLFLDEIGELEPSLQAKLLDVIDERKFRRVGGIEEIPLDARLIAASNRNLKAESESGRFRLDLFYRLSLVIIEMPPLKDRTGDLPLLIKHFIDDSVVAGRLTGVSPEALRLLESFSWPGNIRQLRNMVDRAGILGEHSLIQVSDLPDEIQTQSSEFINLPADNGWSELRAKIASRHPDGKSELVDKRIRDRIRLSEEETARAKNGDLVAVMNEVYQELLLEVIGKTKGNIVIIKEILGDKSEKTIKNALSDYGIEVEKNGGRFVVKNQATV